MEIKPEFEFVVSISYLEIYNEIMFDDGNVMKQRPDITFQEDSKGNLTIKGLTKHKVTNEEEDLNLLFEGESNRTISQHQLNEASSLSH